MLLECIPTHISGYRLWRGPSNPHVRMATNMPPHRQRGPRGDAQKTTQGTPQGTTMQKVKEEMNAQTKPKTPQKKAQQKTQETGKKTPTKKKENAKPPRREEPTTTSALVEAAKSGVASDVVALLAKGDADAATLSEVLREASKHGQLEIVKTLVGAGADIEAEGKYGSALIYAISGGQYDVLAYLLSIGANADAEEIKQSASAFSFAAQKARLDMMRLLMDSGADITKGNPLKLAVGGSRGTVEQDRLEVIHFLMDRGFDPNAATQYQGSVIHAACGSGSLEMLSLLIDRGFDIHALDNRGWTPLHSTCYTPNPVGAKIELLLARGAKDDVAIESKFGMCPLHLLLTGGNATVSRLRRGTKAPLVKLFMDAGADPNLKCRQGRSPLDYALFDNGPASEDILHVIRLLVAHGAVWDASCEQSLAKSRPPRPKKNLTEEKLKAVEKSSKRCNWHTGMHACIRQWTLDRVQKGGDALTNIPIEVIQEGDRAVEVYLADQRASTAAQKVSRSKICVVGPSEWGKTSLVKSVTTLQPSLVHIEDRTIGIDLFPCSFQEEIAEQADPRNHEVTFWDFAGQDVYHVAHALFFSKRTLYLLCVDLPVYIEQLRNGEGLSLRAHEAAMVRFVNEHVIRWIETIIVRQPDAEFLIVGTKVDLVENKTAVDEVWMDLKVRLGVWREAFAKAAVASIAVPSSRGGGSHDAERLRVEEMKERLKRMFRDNWIVVSSVDQASVELARQATESNVIASGKEFVMGNKYNRVLELIMARREKAMQSGDAKTRVESLILPSNYLCRAMLREFDDLEVEDCAVILRTLHELGDILWYDHPEAGALRDCVILDPLVVIDLVKEVVSHELPAKASTKDAEEDRLLALLRDEGRMSHELLRAGKLWRHLDEELTQAFKALLNYFHLAYSADGDSMDWDSDLIVPAYWKIKANAESSEPPAVHNPQFERELVRAEVSLAWEYGVSVGVSGTVFDHFAVQSNSPQVKRVVGNRSIECFVRGEFASRILLLSDDTSHDLIRIEVAASDGETAWLNLRYFVMMMEKVLETYPGLIASRHIVEIDSETRKEKRHRVSHLVQELEDAMAMGRDMSEMYEARPWLAADFSWFIEKAWRHPGLLQEIQTRAFVRQTFDKADVLRQLIVRGDRGRLLPALWTAEYDEASGELKVQMLSDLSGVCFHQPIVISVPSGFLATYGAIAEMGAWICSNVIPEMLTLGVVQKVIDAVASATSSSISSARVVHNLIEKLDLARAPGIRRTNSSVGQSGGRLSPSRSRALLCELLKLNDPSFDELRISEVANLQCAVSTSGSYVWAHPQEIKAMGEKLIPCDPEYSAASLSRAPPPPTTSKSLELTLTVDHLEGLSSWDSYKVLCAWHLIHPSSATPLAAGTTQPLSSDASAVTWASTAFDLTGVESLEMLRGCVLHVVVKRASRFLGKLKLLGTGSALLSSFVPEFCEPDDAIAKPIVIELQPKSSSVVTCSIAPRRIATCA